MLQNDERSEFAAVRLTVQEKQFLEQLARIEQLSLSALLRLWIRTAATQYGLLRPPLPAKTGRDGA